jgi:regulating synaptic membrane exocytosis protein 2
MPLNDEPEWYYLAAHEESLQPYGSRYHSDQGDMTDMETTLTPTDHLSPPSTSTSRLSDSDTTSECDMEYGGTGRAPRDRRMADGASISSLGSSSSPPPVEVI